MRRREELEDLQSFSLATRTASGALLATQTEAEEGNQSQLSLGLKPQKMKGQSSKKQKPVKEESAESKPRLSESKAWLDEWRRLDSYYKSLKILTKGDK